MIYKEVDYSVMEGRDANILLSSLVIDMLFSSIIYIFYNSNIVSMLSMAIFFKPIKRYYTQHIIRRRKEILELQFFEYLSILKSNLQVGENFLESNKKAKESLKQNFEKNNFMRNEIEILLLKNNNGISIKDAFASFAKRSDLKSIQSFSKLYTIAATRTNRIEELVQETIDMMQEAFDKDKEINTLILEKKIELYILTVLPVFLILFFRLFSPVYYQTLYSSIFGRIVITISLALFALAQILARKIIGRICDY
jgi:tight adherence protein B